MIAVAALIEPLRILLTTLGTGVLPPGNAAEQIGHTSSRLEQIRNGSRAALGNLDGDWRGHGADGTAAAVAATDREMSRIGAGGTEFARIVDDASRKVKVAATQLSALVDSFEKAAIALGPMLWQPAGLAVILPVALDHVGRGAQIVARTQHDLTADTARVAQLARHIAPAAVTVGEQHPDPADGRIPIRLPDGSLAYAPDERAATAVRAALSQRGVPYLWGGTTPNGFDCSGLTKWAYHQAGVELPRLAQDQDTAGVRVSREQLLPGDLAVWSGHVAMYIGNGQMVEAGDPVQVSPVRTTNRSDVFEGFYRPR
ncbi:C40 family peptidase [Gordonia sp. ABSL1-1]|uniref:C40 family peptidase n=1 Tax=Gordonia sp. ABSL1-1 TaxID=3053923 RepID=UPI002572D345|nr:C40 family peptidase [Gordonia sp. ABSL1-1]MDL9937155.1 C40 family peptidase [Gordonia sp. ABSL1-1]